MASDSPLHIEQSLKNLGFSKNETKVLVYLFQVKKSTAKDISRNTAISFASVQFSLSNLQRRELVQVDTSQEDDQYQVCSKDAFDIWIEEQRNKHDAIYDQAEIDIGQFFSFVEEHSWQPGIQYYEGVEGIKEIYEDMVKVSATGSKEIYSWLDIPRIREALGDYLYEYIDKRQKAGVKSHDIIPKNEENVTHLEKNENRDMKFVSNLNLNGEIRIYDSKVAVMTFDGERPVGFVFNSPLIASLFKAIFDSQWNSGES